MEHPKSDEIPPAKPMKLEDNTRQYLQFTLDDHAPVEYKKRWEKFMTIVKRGEVDRANCEISESWVTHMKHAGNMQLTRLKRMEGGVGDVNDDNRSSRQLRYEVDRAYTKPSRHPDAIYIVASGPWSQEELMDTVQAFEAVADEYVQQAGSVYGCLAIYNR